jgi:capsular exopolysaccharide synthesis family protein
MQSFGEADGIEPNPLLESAHLIRASLPSSGCPDAAPQVVMVTSALAREGKTITSAALARSFAEAGWKTLLLDLDLHHAGVHRVFGYRRSPGLTDHLLGERSLEEACRPTTIAGLTLLNAGQRLADGIDDFTTGTFAELTQTLRTKFDRIVVDAPAVSSFAPWIDQKHIDAVIFVVGSGRISRRQIRDAIEILSLNGATLSGFILNRVSVVGSSPRREESPGRKVETRDRDYHCSRAPRHVANGYHS